MNKIERAVRCIEALVFSLLYNLYDTFLALVTHLKHFTVIVLACYSREWVNTQQVEQRGESVFFFIHPKLHSQDSWPLLFHLLLLKPALIGTEFNYDSFPPGGRSKKSVSTAAFWFKGSCQGLFTGGRLLELYHKSSGCAWRSLKTSLVLFCTHTRTCIYMYTHTHTHNKVIVNLYIVGQRGRESKVSSWHQFRWDEVVHGKQHWYCLLCDF